MPPQAAIAADEKALSRTLGELTAAEFIQILGRADLDDAAISLLPDKKKYELWVDETGLPKINVGDLLQRIRREKKKLELEKLKFEVVWKRGMEDVFDRGQHTIDPRVIDEIAQLVADKLRNRVG